MVKDVLRRAWIARFLSPTMVWVPRLDAPVSEVLEALRGEVGSTQPPTLTPSHTLKRAVAVLNASKASSVVVVDDPSTMRLRGVVSLADVFGYFLH